MGIHTTTPTRGNLHAALAHVVERARDGLGAGRPRVRQALTRGGSVGIGWYTVTDAA
jgi:hypothetical protein